MAEVQAAAPKILVLGGTRSGKSAFAQAQAEASGRSLVYIATAHAFDDEMAERIARHVHDRGPAWRTVEAPFSLPDALHAESTSERILVVDCLTLWLSNLMLRDDDIDAASHDLAAALRTLSGPVIFVSNEVGAGIVPDNALARRFRDAQGHLNQKVAAACDAVVLVTAGIAQLLKPAATPDLGL